MYVQYGFRNTTDSESFFQGLSGIRRTPSSPADFLGNPYQGTFPGVYFPEMTTNQILPSAATLALAVCLSGCILITWFQKDPAPTSSQSVTRMGDTVYRIDLQGLESTGRHEMTSNLRKRAAAVTLEAGYDYFIVSGGGGRGGGEPQATPAAQIGRG